MRFVTGISLMVTLFWIGGVTSVSDDAELQLLRRLVEALVDNPKRQALFAAYDKPTDTVRVELQLDAVSCQRGCFFKIEIFTKSNPKDILDVLYETWDPRVEKQKSVYVKLAKYRAVYQKYNGKPLDTQLQFRVCRSNEASPGGQQPKENDNHTCVTKTVDTTKHAGDLNDVFGKGKSNNII